jgi:hypothetical protein
MKFLVYIGLRHAEIALKIKDKLLFYLSSKKRFNYMVGPSDFMKFTYCTFESKILT